MRSVPLFLIPLLLSSFLIADNTRLYPTFTEWYTACASLPTYRTVGSTYAYKPLLLTAHELERTVQESAQVMAQHLKIPAYWISQTMPPAVFFDLATTLFMPYAQKMLVLPGSTLAFHGDLHGDIHSLCAYLKTLQANGFLDPTDAFKISDPSLYMIFLGDYTDRGNYGTEVLYTLMRLKIANPTQVILIRGNHEDGALNNAYGFYDELWTKFKDHALIKMVYQWYHLLPVVLYCGTYDQAHATVFQCCHGGMELGYMPTKLFEHPGTIAYELITKLARATYATRLFPPSQRQWYALLRDIAIITPADVGFMWSDFSIDTADFLTFMPGRGFTYGYALTHALLSAGSTQQVRMVGVIRAHQHDYSRRGMMGLILDQAYPETKGMAKLWRCDDRLHQNELWPGVVCTLNVAPNTPHGTHRTAGFSFDTYVLVRCGTTYPDTWRCSVNCIEQPA